MARPSAIDCSRREGEVSISCIASRSASSLLGSIRRAAPPAISGRAETSGGDHRGAGRHGLRDGEAEAFVEGRVDERRGGGEQAGEVLLRHIAQIADAGTGLRRRAMVAVCAQPGGPASTRSNSSRREAGSAW